MEMTDFRISNKVVNLIAELDEFKGSWRFVQNLNSSRLSILQGKARLESIAASSNL